MRAFEWKLDSVGLIAAPFTPFSADLGLDLGVVEQQAAHLRESGVVGAFVGGTTGEFTSLTISERISIAEEWRRSAHGLKLLVHVGSSDLATATQLAKHAEEISADAIGAVPPFYFRPGSVENLVECMAMIAAAAPNTPFFYYHIPAMTKVELSMVSFIEQSRKAIPTFAGVKFTHSDLVEYAQCVDAGGDDLEIMFGRDGLLLPALSLGCKVAVGSTYNFAASNYLQLAGAMYAGDFASARRAQAISRNMLELASTHGGLVAQKALAGMLGVDCGPARPPFASLDEKAMAGLSAFITESGLLQATK